MIGIALAVVTGIFISTSVVSALCDELTESEKQKQRDLQEELERYYQSAEEELGDVFRDVAQREEALAEEYEEQVLIAKKEFLQKKMDLRNAMIDQLLEKAQEQVTLKEKLRDEIGETITCLKKYQKEHSNTTLRQNALAQLERELGELKEKVFAYMVYLQKYRKQLEGMKKRSHLEPYLFSFTLPETWLYQGKLFSLPYGELERKGTIKINDFLGNDYTFDEEDFLKDYSPEQEVPLMVGRYDKKQFAYSLSAKKGMFKQVVTQNPRLGITGKVVAVTSKGGYQISYEDCVEMTLWKSDLYNPARPPLIGAEIRVFPTQYRFDLSSYINVSERQSDACLQCNFQELPLVFTQDSWEELNTYLEENDFDSRDAEWKIAPLDESTVPNVEVVKLQLSTDLLLQARIVTEEGNKTDGKKGKSTSGRQYFLFEKRLDLDQCIRPEDIYLPLDSSLTVVLQEEMDDLSEEIRESLETMNQLVLTVFSEFKLQLQIKQSQPGMEYFNQWAELTEKLFHYLQKGASTPLKVLSYEMEEKKYPKDASKCNVFLDNVEEIQQFFQSVAQKKEQQFTKKHKADKEAKMLPAREQEFFIETEEGEYLPSRFQRNGDVLTISGKEIESFFAQNKKILPLFAKEFPYPEIQQLRALEDFRSGKLANISLQAYALDGSNIQSQEIDFPRNAFFNPRLSEDPSQRQSVERILSQKEIFLLQGPPGTGKTTVIREIIRQTMTVNPHARILVVSQANVAVDNVLEGLMPYYSEKMLRLGNNHNVSAQIRPISFETKYHNYVKSMRAKEGKGQANPLLKQWLRLLGEENTINPEVGTLLFKSHRILGVTCVGLAKKNIGLERIVFDLVIIDEAGKALPAELLIPYNRAKKVVLIGDHKQLPPTIHPALLNDEKIEMSDRDIRQDSLFGESFFERCYGQAPDECKNMLTVQYRMPAVLGTLVSELFYQGKVTNGTGTEHKPSFYFPQNITLLDMSRVKEYGESKKGNESVHNPKEVEVLLRLLRDIRGKCGVEKRIAVITPYKKQYQNILLAMNRENMDKKALHIDVNTVDAFQGDEAEIVIFLTTRAHRPTRFFSDYRRINVALSRAKNELIVVGSLGYFYRYREEGAVLPQIANYFKKYGAVLPYENYLPLMAADNDK